MNIWIEMSRDEAHGGPGWTFTECLWAPTHKNPNGIWPFWQLLLSVKQGDVIFHLRGKTHLASFVGYSIADSDGYLTYNRPPIANQWSYASTYYRVPLKQYTPFVNPIKLDDVFKQSKDLLEKYFKQNEKQPKNLRQHIFFVIQSDRLQCLNGAYLSQMDDSLASILFGKYYSGNQSDIVPLSISVPTGQQLANVKIRIGQAVFSENVRGNYSNQCCFPDCNIGERQFLVGAHIARWSDVPELRGQTSNGLCFCLLHDRAFELGFFTLSPDLRVCANPSKVYGSAWARSNITPFEGQHIRAGNILPSVDGIKHHWSRIGYSPLPATN